MFHTWPRKVDLLWLFAPLGCPGRCFCEFYASGWNHHEITITLSYDRGVVALPNEVIDDLRTAGSSTRQFILVAFAGIVALIIILPIFTMLGLWFWENALRVQSGEEADYSALPWHFWAFLLSALVVAAVAANLISEKFGEAIFSQGTKLLGGNQGLQPGKKD